VRHAKPWMPSRGLAAESVGFTPLPVECGVQVAAWCFRELNHDSRPRQMPSFGETQLTPEQ
jgi:hypothetical protein